MNNYISGNTIYPGGSGKYDYVKNIISTNVVTAGNDMNEITYSNTANVVYTYGSGSNTVWYDEPKFIYNTTSTQHYDLQLDDQMKKAIIKFLEEDLCMTVTTDRLHKEISSPTPSELMEL